MEDGNCHQVNRENQISIVDGTDEQLIHKESDGCLSLNGSAGKSKRTSKKNSLYPEVHQINDFLKKPSTVLDPSKKNSLPSANTEKSIAKTNPVPKIPKPIITKHSSFKRVLKRPYDDSTFRNVINENGDHKAIKYPIPTKASKERLHSTDPAQLQQHTTQLSKFIPKKRRKLDESQRNDYAQYLGLQPAVKFKCGKCCSSSFESLGMLKQHQRFCSHKSQVSPPAPSPVGPNNTNFRITRKVYLCSACGTYYENWNLFLHIREVHNRHTCLFCFGMFSQAQKLASHLLVKHHIPEDYFLSEEELASKFPDSFYLLCCKCEKVFNERENFASHECTQVVKQCSACKLRGGHVFDCPKNIQKLKSPATLEKGQKRKHPPLESAPSIGDNKLKVDSSPHVTKKSPIHPMSQEKITIDANDSLNGETLTNDVSSDKDFSNNVKVNNCNADLNISATLPSSQVLHNNNNKEEALPAHPIPRPEQSAHSPASGNNLEMRNSARDLNGSMEVGNIDESNQAQSNLNVHSGESFDTPSNFPQDAKLTHTSCHAVTKPPPIPKLNITMSQNTKEVYVVSKPPPRNRRPPKRYLKNCQETEQAIAAQPEMNEIKEIVNKVPKLTVKVPKVLMEKESTSDYSSESEDSDKLTMDIGANCEGGDNSASLHDNVCKEDPTEAQVTETQPPPSESDSKKSDSVTDSETVVAGEEIPVIELTLDRPLDRYSLKDLLKVFLSATVYNCIYCNHARKIAVNAKQLSLHFIAQHRFSATVDSITAEELLPETIVLKVKSSLEQVQDTYLNLEGYESEDKSQMTYYDSTLECFQCFYVTKVHKELYLHNRKMHQKTILLCIMCKSNFYSYSELLCHLCPGTYVPNIQVQFRCCLCLQDSIPSAFRLMVHLRKCHHACDVCLDTCQNQSRLSNHIWKHKLHHLCYRCGIAYRNKPDITKHLFWKHGTESVLCKKCLQKRWPHVYHFCIPPTSFICEECNLAFTKAVSLKVHKRIHTSDRPYSCSEADCTEKFISKKLLKQHEIKHLEPPEHLEDPQKDHVTLEKEITTDEKKPEELNISLDKSVKVVSCKAKKSKKNKRNKDKDNLLIDVNLPALNLSESDSSEESVSESAKKSNDNVVSTNDQSIQLSSETPENPNPEPPVPGIWDNFKLYQAQVEKQTEVLTVSKPRHVCDSDHDYCVIPSLDDESAADAKATESPSKDSKRKLKAKKKSGRRSNVSSSSDSSSDSDSSCSCASNCSCSSSSGSSSSSSSSSDSESSSMQRKKKTAQKDSDASAVDIMATEESPLRFVPPEPLEIPIAESDLDTEETETDEDFYDEYPQRLANKILAEKRNQLMLLATVAPVNNGSFLESSRPASPATPETVESSHGVKKKVKTKKKKKLKKISSSKKQTHVPNLSFTSSPVHAEGPRINVLPNKITISLQTNTVIDKSASAESPRAGTMTGSDSDNKRASKRRRVPNKFYGYSSDEENALKPQLPPKLEWRKEDLPSPSGTQPKPVPEVINLGEILARASKPVTSPKIVFKEPIYTSSDDDSDSSREGALQINFPAPEPPPVEIPPPVFHRPPIGTFPFPRPAGVRQAREGESVYCYCRCPYDEVSEMIACDAEGCSIEWFHFECVGIMVPPKGKWFCPDCRQRLEDAEI